IQATQLASRRSIRNPWNVEEKKSEGMLRGATKFLRIARSPRSSSRYSTLSERVAQREREKLKQYLEETKEFVENAKHKENGNIGMRGSKENQGIRHIMKSEEMSEKDGFANEELERMHEEGFDRGREKTNCPIF
uniref:Uncharacterized protein n=1 Tax=Parascaris univalens TaxID=6257 RepID=A0A915BEW9_PARUN